MCLNTILYIIDIMHVFEILKAECCQCLPDKHVFEVRVNLLLKLFFSFFFFVLFCNFLYK